MLMTQLVDDGARTIGFTRSRRAAELLAEFTRRGVARRPGARRRSAPTGRATWRRTGATIERQLADGDLVAVAATNALELGIDIGSLDAAVLTGYPGHARLDVAAGRPRRAPRRRVARVLVAQDDPLDQYLAQHPDELFDLPAEAAVIDPTNPYVPRPAPALRRARACRSPTRRPRVLRARRRSGARRAGADGGLCSSVARTAGTTSGRTPPHRDVDIRAGGGSVYRIVLGRHRRAARHERRAPRVRARCTPAPSTCIRASSSWCRSSTSSRGSPLVESADPDFYTQARDVTDITIVNQIDHRSLGDAELCFGDVEVTNQVVGFVRKLVSTNEIVGEQTAAAAARDACGRARSGGRCPAG